MCHEYRLPYPTWEQVRDFQGSCNYDFHLAFQFQTVTPKEVYLDCMSCSKGRRKELLLVYVCLERLDKECGLHRKRLTSPEEEGILLADYL